MTNAIDLIAWLELDEAARAAELLANVTLHMHPPFQVWTESVPEDQHQSLVDEGCYHFLTGGGSFIQAIVNGYGGVRLSWDAAAAAAGGGVVGGGSGSGSSSSNSSSGDSSSSSSGGGDNSTAAVLTLQLSLPPNVTAMKLRAVAFRGAAVDVSVAEEVPPGGGQLGNTTVCLARPVPTTGEGEGERTMTGSGHHFQAEAEGTVGGLSVVWPDDSSAQTAKLTLVGQCCSGTGRAELRVVY
jgi:hypothetical protein